MKKNPHGKILEGESKEQYLRARLDGGRNEESGGK